MWEKKGLLYQPGGRWWHKTHCYLPTAYLISDDAYSEERIRVYFSGLDENLYGRIGYVEFDQDLKVLYETPEPILDLGEPGWFDDSGVTPSCIVPFENTYRLYYIGWQRHQRVPYSILAGMAVSNDGCKTFKRLQSTPILERKAGEENVRSATSILYEGAFYRMWYVSQSGWTEQRGKVVPSYVISTCISRDGIEWGHPEVCLKPEGKEFGVGRPWVMRENGKYVMYFSARQKELPYYRIGYAESWDGIEWTRGEDPITVSETGWDSEMVCFASVCGNYAFYNGNEHGKAGFGYAVRTLRS